MLLVLLATLLWSTNGFFAKSPWFHDWSGTSIACWRALFASLILFPLVRRPCWRLSLIPVALVFAGMNVFFLTAMQRGSAANAIWLQHTAPFWVVLLGSLWLGEKVGWRDLFVLAFQMIGVVLKMWHREVIIVILRQVYVKLVEQKVKRSLTFSVYFTFLFTFLVFRT